MCVCVCTIYGAPSKARSLTSYIYIYIYEIFYWGFCFLNRAYLVNTYIFLLGILIFKGLTALRPYKSFGVNGLIR
jgi:hypothetical protein